MPEHHLQKKAFKSNIQSSWKGICISAIIARIRYLYPETYSQQWSHKSECRSDGVAITGSAYESVDFTDIEGRYTLDKEGLGSSCCAVILWMNAGKYSSIFYMRYGGIGIHNLQSNYVRWLKRKLISQKKPLLHLKHTCLCLGLWNSLKELQWGISPISCTVFLNIDLLGLVEELLGCFQERVMTAWYNARQNTNQQILKGENYSHIPKEILVLGWGLYAYFITCFVMMNRNHVRSTSSQPPFPLPSAPQTSPKVPWTA